MHQTQAGGFLNMHADFRTHHHHPTWVRRLNLIVYLNPDWKPEWGGDLELWDSQMTHCVTKLPPIFNHAVIFNTTDDSYHGYPDPIQCPPGVTRKSLALYYYTVEAAPAKHRSTNYKARPKDSWWHRFWMWADNNALRVYSWLKRRLGLSDKFASSLLKMLSRKSKG